MPKAFLPAVAENFQNAENSISKFLVEKITLDALDAARKEEQSRVPFFSDSTEKVYFVCSSLAIINR